MNPPLANPFRQDDSGPRRPPPAVSGREWSRIYIMALVFLMSIGVMVYIRRSGDSSKAKPRPPGEQVDFKVREDKGTAPPPVAPDGQGKPDEPGKKKEVAIAPLPKDGIVPYKELAAPFKDGMEKVVKETPEFINLVNVFLHAVTPESIAKAVNPKLNADLAYLQPIQNRGEVVHAYGRLIKIYTERLDATTPDNIEVVYLGILQEYKSNRTVWFYMAEKPKDAAGKPIEFNAYKKGGEEYFSDWIEVDGMFLRQYVYPSQFEDDKGNTIHARAAVLFAKNLRLSRKPEMKDWRGWFYGGVAGIAAIAITIVLVAGIMSRKYGDGSLRMKIWHLKKDQGKLHLPAAKPTGSGPILGDEIPKPPPPTSAPENKETPPAAP
ncbi:MAG TPA: hypothetical protein VJB14_08900 [Planctomycetota bacterium]|nr:hypothetical protein [Planctomycetota bacterium]